MSFRVEIDGQVQEAIQWMAGGRRQGQLIEAIIPVVEQAFRLALEGKADPFDPMTRALLPFVEMHRQRAAKGG